MPPLRLASLHLYPIKGCRGIAVHSVEIDRLGVVGDRRFMLVDANGRFISQREVPLLTQVRPIVEGDGLRVACDGMPDLIVEPSDSAPLRHVTIWDNALVADDQGDAAAAWFSSAVAAPCRLVHFGAQSRRFLNPMYSPRPDAETAFADGYPLLATLMVSLDDLNTRLEHAVPMDRFRPNMVIEGGEAWSEDRWRSIDVGGLEFDAVKPCARCLVTTTDQYTGARDPQQQPLRTIAQSRTIRGLGAIFGQNMVPRRIGSLRMNDPVQVTATRPAPEFR